MRLPLDRMPPYLRSASRWISGLRAIESPGALPDVMIIGAQKAGTTSLFEYLAQHPFVSVSLAKEVHFFDNSFDKGERWYRQRFPPRREGQLVLEASPYYLFHPLAPMRASGVVPSAKLIVLLREPVSRAFSHYQHELDRGRETLSFEEAIAAEPNRLRNTEERLASGDITRSFQHQHFSYVSRGLYIDQIERWLEYFPRSSLLFIKAEDMFFSPQEGVDRVCDFLSLVKFQLLDPSPRYQRHYAPLSDATREKLARFYEEPNRRLAALTGIEWD